MNRIKVISTASLSGVRRGGADGGIDMSYSKMLEQMLLWRMALGGI
jgi:hypothetical protein